MAFPLKRFQREMIRNSHIGASIDTRAREEDRFNPASSGSANNRGIGDA